MVEDAGNAGGSGGAGQPGAPGAGTVYYSTQLSMIRVDMDGTETELAVQNSMDGLILSLDGSLIAHKSMMGMRVLSTTDGSVVLDSTLDYGLGAWRTDDTLLVGNLLGTNVTALAELNVDGTESNPLDVGTLEYCTVGPYAMSPDATQAVVRCGYGFMGSVAIADFDAGTVMQVSGADVDALPVWLAGGLIAFTMGGNLTVLDPANGTPEDLGVPAHLVTPAGPDAVIVTSQETGMGGLIISTFSHVAVPSGDAEAIDWLTEKNPVFENVVYSADGEQVLYSAGNGVFVADADGANERVIREATTEPLTPAIESVTW
jgi:hypothetical protein